MIKFIQKTLLCVIVCVSLCLKINAQTLKAYVTIQANTTNGYIKYKKWNRNPTEIYFSETSNGTFNRLTINEINSFGVYVNNKLERYDALKIKVDESSTNLQNLTTIEAPIFSKEIDCFALVLVNGKVRLYNYTDDIKDHYLVSKDGSVATELINKAYIDQSTQKLQQNQTYKSQLSQLLSDCNIISANIIRRLNFNSNDLSTLIAKYNNCVSGSSPASDEIFTKGKVEKSFRMLAGISQINLRLPNIAAPYDDFKLRTTAQPVFAVGLDLIPPRSKFSFNLELMYHSFKGDYTTNSSATNYFEETIYLYDFKYVRLNTSAKYSFSKSNLMPYLKAGIGNGIAISKKSSYIQTSEFFSTNRVIENQFDHPSYEFAAFCAAGLDYKHYGIEGRYEGSYGFFNNRSDSNQTPKTLYIMASYKF